jgi:ribosomal protein S18 acetylase RimI-like enzyme
MPSPQQPSGPLPIAVRALEPADGAWVRDFLLTHNHALRVVSRGVLHQADELPGFAASLAGTPSALLTYHLANGDLEVVTLHAAQKGRGLGSALLEAAREKARELGCRRLWLITTNDNDPAIEFYKRRGMALVAVHENALEESRRLKPEIPLTGFEGRPIRDELEFEYRF